MKKIYRTKEEIKQAIQENGWISGVVEIPFDALVNHENGGIDYLNKVACEQLVTKEYSKYLTFALYRVVGVNVEKQTLFIEIEAEAHEILKELEENKMTLLKLKNNEGGLDFFTVPYEWLIEKLKVWATEEAKKQNLIDDNLDTYTKTYIKITTEDYYQKAISGTLEQKDAMQLVNLMLKEGVLKDSGKVKISRPTE